MESESESRDIGSVQQRTLPPLQSWEGTALDSIREERSPQVSGHRVAVEATDIAVAHAADGSTLPSTVPESDHGAPQLHSQPLQSMSSPNAATQELPASEVDNIVANSRSHIARDEPTQHTLNTGDVGHVDFISSFVVSNGDNTNSDDHDGDDSSDTSLDKTPSIDSSPHAQNPLSQFPESQRFKTPATAGKKRDYLGNTKETPDLPRPDLRFGEATPAHVIRLSQVFDATQAQTSPVTHGIAPPPVDRPSPTVDIELRPATVTSPAMRPIAEPDARYVSVAQSQAERYRRASSNLPDDDSDDDFSNHTDHLERQRREQARRDRITKSSLSSPPKRRRRASPPTIRPNSPPQLFPNIHDLNESEAETEQDDEEDDDGHGLEQPRPDIDIDIENKENDERMIIQIPQTAIRLQRATQDVLLPPSDSPLFRRDARGYVSSSPAVVNSQFSQPFPRGQSPLKPSGNSDIDCVPQSQAYQPVEHDQEDQLPQLHGDCQERSDTQAPDANHLQSQLSARPHLVDTIPESSSSKHPQSANRLPDRQPSSRSNTTSNFETAQSCLPPASGSRSNISEMSSPPIFTGPPARKRKRMQDIGAGPSSQLSLQGFDPVPALGIDTDPQLESSQSPTQARPNRSKVRLRRREIIETRTSLDDQGVKPAHHIISQGHVPMTESPHEYTQTPRTPIARPRSGLRRANRSATATARADVWDHEVSPEKPDSPPQGPVRTRLSVLPSRRSRRVSTAAEDVEKSQRHQGHRPDLARSRKAPEEAEAIVHQASSASSTPASRPSIPTLPSNLPTTVNPLHSTKAPAADRITAPDMVFACFNGKTRAYYPARCLEKIDLEGDIVRYRVQWDSTDPDEVDAYGIRAVDLRVDDQVKIDMKGFAKAPYVVRGFKDKVDTAEIGTVMTDIRGFRTILVARKQRKSLPADISTEATQEVPIAAIYLDNNMWGQLKNRALEFRPQSSQPFSTSGHITPVERQATPNTPSSRTRKLAAYGASVSLSPVQGLFANMVFAISYDDPTMKDTVATAIEENGGTVVRGSFIELLQSDTVALKPEYQTAGFTALLADGFSRKEKYMQALALGLPCLSGRWILDSIERESIADWQTYLLPAGESAALDGAVRSRILPNLHPHNAKLVDMLQSRPQPLAKITVAAITGKGKAEAKRKPYLFLIHALGAASISKFPDVKAIKDHVAQSDADWLFVDDRDVDAAEAELSRNKTKHASSKCKVAGNELIVQSVILGKLYT